MKKVIGKVFEYFSFSFKNYFNLSIYVYKVSESVNLV